MGNDNNNKPAFDPSCIERKLSKGGVRYSIHLINQLLKGKRGAVTFYIDPDDHALREIGTRNAVETICKNEISEN